MWRECCCQFVCTFCFTSKYCPFQYILLLQLCSLLSFSDRYANMEDSSSSKPFMVTSSLNFKVTTPSFYNQPKKFASVAPPRPKSLTPPSAPSPTPIGTAVIGRVGDVPPPPTSLCDGTCIIYAILSTVLSFFLPSSLALFPPLLIFIQLHAELHKNEIECPGFFSFMFCVDSYYWST